jgi:hypothetical protein
MLLEGLYRIRSGQTVAFVDRAARVGGAWQTPPALGFAAVETGVHLIENRPALNAAFEALMGRDGLVVGTPDFGLAFGRRIPMPLARILLYAGVAGKAVLAGRKDRARHALRNAVTAAGTARVPLVYPAGGFSAVLDKLRMQLTHAGAQFRLDTEIRQIRVADDRVVIDTSRGMWQAGALVMSSRAHAPIVGMEPLWDDLDQSVFRSISLRLSGPSPRFDGYVEFLGDPLIKRARRLVTTPLPGEAAGRDYVVTVQLRNGGRGAAMRGAELARRTAAGLRLAGLLPQGTRIADSQEFVVNVRTLPMRSLKRIARSYPEQVHVLNTVDLSDVPSDLYRMPEAGLRLAH